MHIVCLLRAASSPARAAVDAPLLHADDTWTFLSTREVNGAGAPKHVEQKVVRASASGILIEAKEVGSTIPPKTVLVGADWSRSRSVNGVQTVVNKPLNFPLSAGKTWEVDYFEDHPDRLKKNQHIHLTYTVGASEKVTVLAGTFDAVKVEADGDWTGEMEASATTAAVTRTDQEGATAVVSASKVSPKTTTGHIYMVFWYAPEAKRLVKTDEEYFNSNNTLGVRETTLLESYKLSQ